MKQIHFKQKSILTALCLTLSFVPQIVFASDAVGVGKLPVAQAAQGKTNANIIDQNRVEQIVDQQFKPLLQRYNIPGMSIAISVNGQHFFVNYGVASQQTKQAVTAQTLFELGSISKVFNTTLASYAEQQGSLAWSQHPAQYFPELKNSDINHATLLNLATYTAGGLPLQFPDDVQTHKDIVAYYKHWKALAAAGQVRQYSNPSIGLLGEIAALSLKKSYKDAMTQYIFKPMGLTQTYIEVPSSEEKNYAWGYNKNNAPVRVQAGPFDAQAYGVKSTSADMIKFLDLQIHHQKLATGLQKAIQQTQKGYFQVGAMHQGLGWEYYDYPLSLEQLLQGNSSQVILNPMPAKKIDQDIQGKQKGRFYNKTGSTGGFGGYVAYVPQKELALVMLANKNFPNEARIEATYKVLQQISLQQEK